MGSLLLLAALSHKCRITADALISVLKSIAKAKRVVSPVQLLTTLVAVAAPQDPLPKLPSRVADILVSNTEVFPEVLQLEHSEHLFAAFVATCVEKADEHHRAALAAVIVAPAAPRSLLCAIASAAIAAQAQNAEAEFDDLLGSIKQRHPDAFADAVKYLRSKLGDEVVDATILAVVRNSELGKLCAHQNTSLVLAAPGRLWPLTMPRPRSALPAFESFWHPLSLVLPTMRRRRGLRSLLASLTRPQRSSMHSMPLPPSSCPSSRLPHSFPQLSKLSNAPRLLDKSCRVQFSDTTSTLSASMARPPTSDSFSGGGFYWQALERSVPRSLGMSLPMSRKKGSSCSRVARASRWTRTTTVSAIC